jgi:hypothetical protein
MHHVLRGHTLPHNRWELIVVGNKATNRSRSASTFPGASGCALFESKRLVSLPRRRGNRERTGELLVFVDDDNVLDADFLETALRTERKAVARRFAPGATPRIRE